MASISRQSNGRRTIQFIAANGKRKSIRLGKVSQAYAVTVCGHIEKLVAAERMRRAVDLDTAEWVGSLGDDLADKLAAVGLTPKRTPEATDTLAHFLKGHLTGRANLKPATKVVRQQVIHDLTEFFGVDRDLRSITPGDADDFMQWLLGRDGRRDKRKKRKLAQTTVHKRLEVARWFFRAMRRRKLIEENPFEDVSLPAAGIKDRQRLISRGDTAKVIEACPDRRWRLIVVLARYGGLRCPSEVLSLRWQDVDWDRRRINVRSPKTEHHEGKAERQVPLFPELEPHLSEAFDVAPEGAVYVVDEQMYARAQGPAGWKNANLRTTFEKIIRRAGLALG